MAVKTEHVWIPDDDYEDGGYWYEYEVDVPDPVDTSGGSLGNESDLPDTRRGVVSTQTPTINVPGASAEDQKKAQGILSKAISGTLTSQDFIDYLKANPLGASSVLGGLANLNAQPSYNRVGYQGTIPNYVASRVAVPYQYDPDRRPGSGGRQYFTDVRYTQPTPEAVKAAQIEGRQEAKDIAAQQPVVPLNAPTPKTAAHGGLMALARGRYLRGSTDGMEDKLPASIDGREPAKLSHGEFVIPADVVSHLGNGNSDAGAKKLYSMMDKIRMARTGTKKQGKQINPDKYMPGGSVGYASGGGITGYPEGGLVDTSTKPTQNVYESNLSSWAGPYVTGMLGKGQALSEMPYQAYQGPLTAGASNLQQSAFKTAQDLKVPDALKTAATTAGDVATKMGGLSYTPTSFTNQYQAPTVGAATQFTNQYQAPSAYQTGQFATDTFGAPQAQQYMNPYLQAALDPQIAEARRQAQITNMQNMSRLSKAGAYGGSRQAILQAESDRNLAQNLANITGQGYNTAYQNAMTQFNADQARKQAAQQATEQSRQFGAGQQATAAQLQAQYGLSAQQAQEAARQFGVNQQATAAQLAAQYGLSAQQAQEAAKQFGASYGLQGLQGALQAAQAQGALGAQQNQIGLANLAQQAALGQQERGITAEGLAADKAQFEEARDYPYKMLQFQQSLLSGLPLQTQAPVTPVSTGLQNFSQAYTTISKLLDTLKLT